ncbi:hypothetical protein JHK86_004640 [Glycine max]|nr:hypothetical protein JHK86_004640 [Glycine max]
MVLPSHLLNRCPAHLVYLVEMETDTYCSFAFSLVIMGNNIEFKRAVLWLLENLTFDVDARINLFEVNIGFG